MNLALSTVLLLVGIGGSTGTFLMLWAHGSERRVNYAIQFERYSAEGYLRYRGTRLQEFAGRSRWVEPFGSITPCSEPEPLMASDDETIRAAEWARPIASLWAAGVLGITESLRVDWSVGDAGLQRAVHKSWLVTFGFEHSDAGAEESADAEAAESNAPTQRNHPTTKTLLPAISAFLTREFGTGTTLFELVWHLHRNELHAAQLRTHVASLGEHGIVPDEQAIAAFAQTLTELSRMVRKDGIEDLLSLGDLCAS